MRDIIKHKKKFLKISSYVEEHNYALPIRELCDIIGVSSTLTAYNLVK